MTTFIIYKKNGEVFPKQLDDRTAGLYLFKHPWTFLLQHWQPLQSATVIIEIGLDGDDQPH